MITPQNGIFAQGTHSHYFLELDIRPGVSAPEALLSLGRLRAPDVSAGGVNFVIGFSADQWRSLAPSQSPADLKAFTDIKGPDNVSAPAQQHAVWIWINGSTPDVVFEHARRAWQAVDDVATLASEQPAFVYRDSRDLTGFLDGTANPEPLDAPTVALLPTGVPGAGGSHVLVMRWVHNLDAFHALPLEEQENVVGRSKDASKRISVEKMPARAHVKKIQVHQDGEELEIYRRSVPYGTLREHGLYFLAFSAEQTRFDKMLAQMFGTADGVRDHLTDFSRAVSGAYYFAPSLTAWRSCAR